MNIHMNELPQGHFAIMAEGEVMATAPGENARDAFLDWYCEEHDCGVDIFAWPMMSDVGESYTITDDDVTEEIVAIPFED